ncbi:MAG: 3'(2'),5'-bisphosphate nucleotidase CysQ, partial [Stellaceae bacterium]
AIMRVYAEPFEVIEKSDHTPVTEADLASERVIVKMLAEAFPDIPIVSEETAPVGGFRPPAARFWCVDPLDGTKEFIAKNDEFSVSIGLIEGDRPVLGIIHAPVANVTYAAAGPGSATRQAGDAAPVPIAARLAPAGGLVVAHSRSHQNSPRLDTFLADYPGATRRVAGSAIKFCLVAEGSADLYPRFGTTMEWDTAAGQAILEAAGGSVTTLDGAPLRYNKPLFRNPGFIARGRQ